MYWNPCSEANDTIYGKGTFIANALVRDEKAPHAYNIYAYDLDGLGNLSTIVNEKDRTQKDFIYNLNGKLDTFQYSLGTNGDSLLTKYYYDALERRVAKNIQIAKAQTQKTFSQAYGYLADEERMLLSKNGSGAMALFVDGQGIDEHLGEATADSAKSYVSDHLGSVLNTEAAAGRKLFGTFGDRMVDSQTQDSFALSENSSAVVYGFAGRELDLESGLYYNRARNYDPQTGRFTSKDPIGFHGGSANLYGYVLNNPVNFTDPNGTNPIALLGPALAFEVGYDIGTFGVTLANTGSFSQSVNQVYASSPLRNLFNTGTSILLPEVFTGPIQFFANPDTMNAIIQSKKRTNTIDNTLKECK